MVYVLRDTGHILVTAQCSSITMSTLDFSSFQIVFRGSVIKKLLLIYYIHTIKQMYSSAEVISVYTYTFNETLF